MPRATTAQIERCLTAARNQGLEVGAVEVTADGTIRLTTAPKYKPDPFEEWEKTSDGTYREKEAS